MNRRTGRPAEQWLPGEALAALAPGVAVAIETYGRHARRTIGRILVAAADHVDLDTPRGEITVQTHRVKRARLIGALYEPGDPVLRRHIPASEWRGGVVRTDGTDVLVEQIDGTFDWFPEAELEPADARDPVAPGERRGPVPARAAG